MGLCQVFHSALSQPCLSLVHILLMIVSTQICPLNLPKKKCLHVEFLLQEKNEEKITISGSIFKFLWNPTLGHKKTASQSQSFNYSFTTTHTYKSNNSRLQSCFPTTCMLRSSWLLCSSREQMQELVTTPSQLPSYPFSLFYLDSDKAVTNRS